MTLSGRRFWSAHLALLILSARISDGSAAPTVPHGNAQQGNSAPTGDSLGVPPATSTGTPAGEAGLGPSSAVPWNPTRPASTGDTWEKVVRFPGLVVSLPLIGLGYVFEHGMIAAEQTSMMQSMLTHAPHEGKARPPWSTGYRVPLIPLFGVTVAPPELGPRTGLGGRLALSPPRFHDALELELSGSMRGYNRTRALAWKGPVAAEYAYDWRPEEPFFGLGSQSLLDDQAGFASQSQFARIGLFRPWEGENTEGPRVRGALWIGTREMVVRSGRESGVQSFEELFLSLAAATLNQKFQNLVYGGRVSFGQRQGTPHWTHGVWGQIDAARFDKPVSAISFSEPGPTSPQFTRFNYQAATAISFGRSPRTLQPYVQIIDTQYHGATESFLLPDFATLGGSRGLEGFESLRFHDLDKAVVKLSYVFPLLRTMEVDLHGEAGGVYHDVWQDLKPNKFRHSGGAILRVIARDQVVLAIGADWSHEAVRFQFDLRGFQ